MKKKINNSVIRKIFKILLLAVLVILLISTTINIWMILSTKDKILPENEFSFSDADCIIILGAGVRDDGTPSHMLEDRLITGVELYKHGCSNTLLMSGDHGRIDYDEVNVMKSYAIDDGVPVDRIFMDHAGFSTYDSIYRVGEIFGAKKIVIVSQKYHLYRALAIANALGIDACGVHADLRTYRGQSTREVREFAARVKDFFNIIFKPEPVYLGDQISLSGSGEVTNG